MFEDERGWIKDVSDLRFEGLQMIFSKKGSVRSNHYHKKGGHLLYVVSGKMAYMETPANETGPPRFDAKVSKTIVSAGECIYTGPLLLHATHFLEDTLLVCLPTMKRTEGGYQDDLVRVDWVRAEL